MKKRGQWWLVYFNFNFMLLGEFIKGIYLPCGIGVVINSFQMFRALFLFYYLFADHYIAQKPSYRLLDLQTLTRLLFCVFTFIYALLFLGIAHLTSSFLFKWQFQHNTHFVLLFFLLTIAYASYYVISCSVVAFILGLIFNQRNHIFSILSLGPFLVAIILVKEKAQNIAWDLFVSRNPIPLADETLCKVIPGKTFDALQD